MAKDNDLYIVPANYPCKMPRDGIIVTAHDEISKLIEFDVSKDRVRVIGSIPVEHLPV